MFDNVWSCLLHGVRPSPFVSVTMADTLRFFGISCLDRITRPSCPICRSYFDPKAIVKLHLDLDNVQASPKGTNAKISPEDIDAAQDLHQRISNIAEQGSSETQVRGLISDVKKFLQDKPRGSVRIS